MNNEMISIIIPTYNRAHLIGETLNSILAQTYENWECIIIDDGSTDNTTEILQRYKEEDTRFQFFARPNGIPKGANACRNYGFEFIRGKYVKWFDSDDIMLPDHLRILVNSIKHDSLDFAVGDSVNFKDETGESYGKPYVFNRNGKEITIEAFATQKIGWITDDFLCKAETIGDLRFNTLITTDGDEYNFFTRFLLKNENGKFINEILTKHRLHSDSLSSPEKYSDLQFFYKISQIKFLTFLDIEKSREKYLKKWFLKGYMLNSFLVAMKRNKPFKFRASLKHIARHYSLFKALSFMASIITAYCCKKGYYMLKYSRK